DERALRAGRSLVERLGDQLLADPGLSGDEDGGVGRRQLLETGEQLAHLDAAPQHRAEAIAAGELELDRLAEGLEAQLGGPDDQLRPRVDVDVVDPQAGDEGSVGRVEVAESVAALVEQDLAMQAADLGVREL